MIMNSIPYEYEGGKGRGDGDCVGGGDRSKEGWGWCGRGTQEKVAWDTLEEERQEGQRLRSKGKRSIFKFNDSIKRWTSPRGPNSRFRLGIGVFLRIFSYHSA